MECPTQRLMNQSMKSAGAAFPMNRLGTYANRADGEKLGYSLTDWNGSNGAINSYRPD